MNWYLAKLVYRITCGRGTHVAQFEEQLRLIQAEDELHAFYKARLIGDSEGIMTAVEGVKDVRWKFIDVSELFLIAIPGDGAEIYGVVSEQPDAELYIRNTQKQAAHLLQLGLHQFKRQNYSSVGN